MNIKGKYANAKIFTDLIDDKIIPNLVGVDIGCGMLVVELGHLTMQLEDLKKLDAINI